MDLREPNHSVFSWNDSHLNYDMQGPMDMTYDEAYTEVMQCFLPAKQSCFDPISPACSSSTKSYTPQPFTGTLEASVNVLNTILSTRSESPASSPTSQIDLRAVRQLSKRQKNRDAQRAYRERKEKLLQTLVEKVEKLEAAYNTVKEERDQLQQKLDSLIITPPLAEESLPDYHDQFAAFTNFQFDNYLFSNLSRHQTVLPLS
ncbi:hypothetical protein V8C35DRAFT_309552 [Trichoderma chlorosporum]